ncbi:MAG: hypothetical protein MRJ96_08300 [Nitrospirales bacterium]|nr:hypothetical protein [Nitrospira sp.]MDR4501433.1 hypothetical protein [Nitrospirales bacterium]
MKNLKWIIGIVLSLIILGIALKSHAESTNALNTIELEVPIHFLTPDGSDLRIGAGEYVVEPAQDWIRIIPSHGLAMDAYLLEAHVGRHQESLKTPLALSVTGIEPDSHHLVLLLPDGKSFEATGSYSGIRSRAGSKLSRQQLQALLASRQSTRSTEFETPLLGGGGGKKRYNLDCGPNGVMVGVTTKSGSWIDALGLICQEVNHDGSLGEDYTRKPVGGSGGTGRIDRCGDGRVVGGFHARSGMFVNGITMFCPRWDAAKKRPRNFKSPKDVKSCNTECAFAGAPGTPFGGTRSDDFFCPGNKVGKALRGKYGTYIDSVSFVCDEWNR